MANPSGKKGTAFEVECQGEYVQPVFGEEIVRVKHRGKYDLGEFGPQRILNYIIECKKRKRWDLRAWIRDVRRANANNEGPDLPWVIFFASDRRKLPGTFAVEPAETWRDVRVMNRALRRRVQVLESVLERHGLDDPETT